MPRTIAIIHTTPVTVEPLKALATELLPGYDVLNWVDDSILPELRRNNGDIQAVAERWLAYARYAEQGGAELILSACSSVSGLVAQAHQVVAVPVLRIDAAMAEEAVRRGTRIGVAATLATTLNPTMELVASKAEAAGKRVELTPMLAASAYQKLMAGDKAGHDADLAAALGDLAASVDVVVLAQASMARVIPSLPPDQQHKCLSSPRSGMERVKQVLEQQGT